MSVCDQCKQEVADGQGVHSWNMFTGYQSFLHEGACWDEYMAMHAWCRMGMHQDCIDYPDYPCSCPCHKQEGA